MSEDPERVKHNVMSKFRNLCFLITQKSFVETFSSEKFKTDIIGPNSRVFLLRQIWIVKYSVKYSTVDCKYLLFQQDFFL